jgi:hypothetical protein
MTPKLPTIMTPHVPLIARPAVYVDEDGVIYVNPPNGGQCLLLTPDPAGHLVIGARHRLAPATAPELLTRQEAATELAELLERIAMSKTARKAVDHVINEYGS